MLSYVSNLFREKNVQNPKSISCSTRNAFSRTILKSKEEEEKEEEKENTICFLQKSDLENMNVDENIISVVSLNTKIRMLQSLNTEEIEYIDRLSRHEILSLFMEYNYALRFLNNYKNNKSNKSNKKY